MSVTGVRFDDVRAFQASLGGLVPQSVVCTLGNAAVNYLDLPGGTWWQCWCPDGVAGKTITLKWLACAADGTQSTTTLGTITLPSGAGSAQVLQGGDLSAYEIDWRKRWRGRARLVVRPGSTEEVAAVVRACAEFGASIVPQGGNTGLVVGGVPDGTGTQVLLTLQRMNRVRAIDPANQIGRAHV